MTELLSAMGGYPFRRLREWMLAASELAVIGGREEPMVALADNAGSMHVWPLDWRKISTDDDAVAYCCGELARELERAGSVAHGLVLPAWMGDDGTLWALAPGEEQPTHDYERVMVVSVVGRDERVLVLGLVDAGPPRRIARWERAKTRRSDAETLALRPRVTAA